MGLSFKCCTHFRHFASAIWGSKTFMCFYELCDKILYKNITICICFTVKTALTSLKEDHKSQLPFLSTCQVFWVIFFERPLVYLAIDQLDHYFYQNEQLKLSMDKFNFFWVITKFLYVNVHGILLITQINIYSMEKV